MRLLPTPAEAQSFSTAYQKASECAEFVPVWGRPTPFYQIPAELSGDWGRAFVERASPSALVNWAGHPWKLSVARRLRPISSVSW